MIMKSTGIRYLIIPDIHGRSFWKNPVEETLLHGDGSRIVFLGDYLDPYPQEWDSAVDCRMEALSGFKQILDLKKQNPENICLLLGNHDCGYALGDDICSCRMDYSRRREIEDLFLENRKEFLLAEQCDIAGRHFIFSHAGILKGWAELVWRGAVSSPGFDVVDRLNNAWLTEDYSILDLLVAYDSYRGYPGYKYGSPIWSDIRSWTKVTPEETYGYNIVGHTQREYPLLLDTIADLDCRQCFFLDNAGDIRYWESGEKVQNPEIH